MTAPDRPGPDLTAWTQSATGTATWMAERAVLGALLRRPERIAEMSTWLSAQDFVDPQHQGVFATIEGLHAAGELRPIAAEFTALSDLDEATQQAMTRNVLAVQDALVSHRFAETYGVTRTLMPDLYIAGAGAGPAQYNRYGQMVVEMSVRRQVEQWGVRMEQASLAEPAAEGDIAALQGTREAMMENLSDLTVQIRRSRGDITSRIESNPAEAPVVVPTAALPPRLVERAERQVIQAVLADPQVQESGLLQRLRPEDFTASKAHENTWRAIQAVAERGPVDPILVAWEAEVLAADPRHGYRAEDRVALGAAELSSMSTEPVGDVGRAVSTVARSALARHARLAQQEIQKAVGDRRLGVAETVATANDVGEELEQNAERLVGVDRKPKESAISRMLSGERSTVGGAQPDPAARPRTR
ncbi:DnaB-like helicase N-terminal domain-containing protein [Actinokineospora enzanensis]|uniref:DnaB-like helicase N-terminal domain-containing protein n=1 Tax=Actinokineospora enzanensis TaxID=155975 RepID=UPI0004759CC8|nr:DnaB-like helicase N-terminal domain-containing protein [Actinokineospora enzanensis]